MLRSREISAAHFKKALKRLPQGVTSNFRYWGDDVIVDLHPERERRSLVGY